VKRRSAVAIGVALATLSGAELVGLSALLSADRSADREAYEAALLAQRRAAGLLLRVQPQTRSESTRDKEFCVRGVDTFATALHRGLGKSALDSDGQLLPDVLTELSNLATRAERYAEISRAAPALPQRMGRQRNADGTWNSLQPPRVDCESGDAFVAFRVALPVTKSAPEHEDGDVSTDRRPSKNVHKPAP
jgi:hypothetical protein